jgi:hypothetical protein
MADIRGGVDYDGLFVSMECDRKDAFFFTGEEPGFKLTVRNPTPVRWAGRVLLTWNLVDEYAQDTTLRPVNIDVAAGKTEIYIISRGWFSIQGRAAYRV